MLTGVEIAGTVLAVLPLVIQAVTWYQEGTEPMADYWNYVPALQLLLNRLNFQATLYEDSIRRLLMIVGVPAEEIHKLVDHVDEPWRLTAAWRDAKLAQKLEDALGKRHFASFIFAVQQIDELMKKLMSKLKLDAQGIPKWNPGGTPLTSASISSLHPRIQYEWRRIARTFSQSKQDKLIEKFKEYNNAIAAFVLNKEILAPPDEDDNVIDSKSYIRYFDLVRKEACSLYKVLEDNWKCSCKDPHNANLQLSFRGTGKSTPVFQVCFSSSGEGSQTWRKTCIHPGPRNGPVQGHRKDILCTALCTTVPQGGLGDLVWTSIDWQIKREIDDTLVQKSTVLHLRSLLAKDFNRSTRDTRFRGLSEKQRRQIAVSLSYSVLQFYDSPWMHDLWGEEDVFFFTGVDKRKVLVVSDPCFSRPFPQRQNPRMLVRNEHLSGHFLDRQIPNKPLFALGIVLLELCLNMPFDDLHDISSIDGDQPGAIEKYAIVMENLDRAFDEWGETFGQVVQRCLNPEFGLRPSETRMDFDKFRCRVYEGIIAPLEKDLKPFI